MSKIRVLIADSSATDIDTYIAILGTDPEIEVVGVATIGRQATALTCDLRPDIVAISESIQDTDLVRTVRHIMAYTPTPILVLSDPDRKVRSDSVLEALSMGALDIIEKISKPSGERRSGGRFLRKDRELSYNDKKSTDLVKAIKFLSKIRVVTHLAGRLEENGISASSSGQPGYGKRQVNGRYKIIAIAASTGGPGALVKILQKLPANLEAGIVIVQHIADGFSNGLAEWLDKESAITVKEGNDGDHIESGCAILAPTGSHMVVTKDGTIELMETAPLAGHRPSADILFESVAELYGSNSVGIILTGMGMDGAKGLLSIKESGGKTIVQDEQSCVVFGMPRAAINMGAVDEILPLELIAERIERLRMSPSYTSSLNF